MIQFDKVSKRYHGGVNALTDVSFTLNDGEMAYLTGHSGAGKSTLLKLIAKLESPSSGQIVVNGLQLNQLKHNAIAAYRSGIGIIFQSPHLLNDRSVFENVALPLHIHGVPPAVVSRRVHAALDLVGLLSKEKLLPICLSAGESQRVGIARAVVHKPSLLLADEPTGNLDPDLSAGVMKQLELFHQAGMSILVATHDLALLASVRHRVMILKAGQLC